MLDVGWTEILVIAIVLIVVVGPKDLPQMLRQFGRTTAKMRAMAGDFRKQFDEALKEAELDDVRDLANQARGLDPRQTIRKHLSPLEKAGQDIKAGLDDAMKPKADTSAEPASPVAHEAAPAKTGAVEKAASNGSGKTAKAAPKKRAAANGTAAKAAPTRKTATKANGNGSAKTNGAAAAAPAKPAAKSPAAKSKTASGGARKTRAASAAGKQDKSGSAT